MTGPVRLVSPLERVLFLRKLAATRGLDSRTLALVAHQARERFYRRGTTIVSPGLRPYSWHIIVEGRVRTGGLEHGEGELGPERGLGLLTLLARWEEGLEATAEADTVTLEIDRDDMYDLFEDHFGTLLQQLRLLAEGMLAVRRKTPTGTYLAPTEGIEAAPVESLDLIERLLYLRRGETFQRANLDALIELARQTEEIRLEPGEVLWRRGAPSGSVYALVMGTMRAVVDPDRYFWLGPGYPLGNLEGLAGRPHWYDAVAETPILALRADTDAFVDVLEDHFDVAVDLLAAMATGLMLAQEQARRRARRAAAAAPPPVNRPT